MKFLYNLFTYLFQLLLPLLKGVSPKMKLFVLGRKKTEDVIDNWNETSANWFWFHCASLGEFEQAVPLIEKIKANTSNKILVTFFSPSGYEQKKNHKLLDKVLYLPIDTPKNAKKFISKIQPKAAFFIKYEFWENYFSVLNTQNIPIYMVSSMFRESQIYFKWYGSFFRNTLRRVTHFFVQNKDSLKVLHTNGFNNVTVSGDTRFDRVTAQLKMDNTLGFIEKFKGNKLCVVLGSTWVDCENSFVNTINKKDNNVCFIIAPHEIETEKIKRLKQKLKVKVSVFSEGVLENSNVLIVDAIGYLTRIYSYADIVYVGGAMGTTGLHNILEPAVFGVPILVGPHTKKFPEAYALKQSGGLIQLTTSPNVFEKELNNLITHEVKRQKASGAAKEFVKKQTGATEKIWKKINQNLSF